MLLANPELILNSCELRKPLVVENPEGAFRLFSGFREGFPSLVIDRFNHTLVLYDYSHNGDLPLEFLQEITDQLEHIYPDVHTIIKKIRNSDQPELRKGILITGEKPDTWIREHRIRYSIDLQMNQDASFYLDTRSLRKWLIENSKGKSILNTFAYTGSLGIASLAGGARSAIQTDLNNTFLNLAKSSCSLNGIAIKKPDYIAGDFFRVVTRLKKEGRLFDIVILDPPFFSDTDAGRVDIVNEYNRLLNKVRPLVAHGGILIAINNALFLSGEAYMAQLEELCKTEYLSLGDRIDVPQDSIGYTQNVPTLSSSDPAPFNHSTKIIRLHVQRKDGKIST